MAAPVPVGGRLAALSSLKNSLSGSSSQVAKQQQAASDIRLGQVAGQAAAAGVSATAPVVQQVVPQIIQQQGQQAVQQVQESQQQAAKLADLSMKETGMAEQKLLSAAERIYNQHLLEQANQLAEMDQTLRDNLLDKQMNFNEDSRQRVLFTEHQLADWAKSNAQSEEELTNWKQQLQFVTERKLQALQIMEAKIKQRMNIEANKAGQEQDQALRQELARAQADLQKKIAKEKAAAANRSAVLSGVGTVAGAVVGGIYGGPVGATAGASAGGAIGSMAAGSQKT